MAYLQKVNVAPNKVYPFSLQDFSGGINNRSKLLNDNQASDLLNMSFTDDVIMERRKGSEPYNSTTRNSVAQRLDQFRPYTDADRLVECDGSQLYMDGVSICTVAGNVDSVNFLGKYFFVDGQSLRVYGVFPQTASTFQRVNGIPTTAYVVMQVVNPPNGFTPLDTTYKQGVTVYDYNVMQVWYEPCANEIADPYKNGNVIPVNPRYIASLNGRLYFSGCDKEDDSIYITDVGNAYYCPATMGMQVPPNSDKIVAMIVYDDSVVIGREHDVYHISGKTNNPDLGLEMFSLKKLNTHTGFASEQSASVAHNYLFFMGSDGNAYSFSTVNTDTKTLATTIISKTLDLLASPFLFSHSDIRSATCYFYQDLWYVSIKQYVFVYSYRLQAWTVYKGLNARAFYNLNDTLIWSSDNGKIMKFSDQKNLDDNTPYVSYWTSKNFDMGTANNYKQFREFFLVGYTFPEKNSEIRVTFEVDYADIHSEVVIQNKIATWGTAHFGDRFITRNINESTPFIIGRRARGIRFTLTSGYEINQTVATVADLASIKNRSTGMLVYVAGIMAYYQFDGTTFVLTDVNQFDTAMRVFQMNGEYELRGKR